MNYKLYARIFGFFAIVGIIALTFQVVHVIRTLTIKQEPAPVVKTPKLDDFTNVDRRNFTL